MQRYLNFPISWPPDSPEPRNTGPPAAANGKHEAESGDRQSGVRRDDAESQAVRRAEVEEEANLTSTPDKAPCGLAPLQLSQLRTKNTDSFDMEEVRVVCVIIFHLSTRIPPPTSRCEQIFPESHQCVIFPNTVVISEKPIHFFSVFKLFFLYYIYIFFVLNFVSDSK